MLRPRWSVSLLLSVCLLAGCGPSVTATPTVVPMPTLPPATAPVPPPTAIPYPYPPPRTAVPVTPTAPPTPTPLPVPLPSLPLLAVAPAADFNVQEVSLLGISQTGTLALQARLRSGETRFAPLDAQVAPAGALYRTQWEDPYLFLPPAYQSPTLSSAPLLVIDTASRTVYGMEVPRGYWAGPFILSPDRRQVAFSLVWQVGGEYGYEPSGPGWEVRVWDLAGNQVRVLRYEQDDDGLLRPYWPVYWSAATGRLYLQWAVLESDAGPQGLASLAPDGSGWQTYDEGGSLLTFSPDGLSAAYTAYDARLEVGHTYYYGAISLSPNQVWVLDLTTGHSRLLLQEEDGAQYAGIFDWTTQGLLLERFRAASHSTIREWELLWVNPATAETSQVLRQEGEWPAPFGGPLSPEKDRILLWNWTDEQYAVLDLNSGQLQNVASLVPEHGPFLWCAGGMAFIDQFGGNVSRIDLRSMSVEHLTGWTEVAFCR